MKKAIYTIIALFFVALFVTACGSGEKCPAYSQVEQTAEQPA